MCLYQGASTTDGALRGSVVPYLDKIVFNAQTELKLQDSRNEECSEGTELA